MSYRPFAAIALLGSSILWTCLSWNGVAQGHQAIIEQATQVDVVEDGEFDGAKAFGTLESICAIGPRVSTSPGMAQQQQMIIEHFEKLGVKSAFQTFNALHPVERKYVQLKNLIVRFHPERKQRILLACHYDTRPFPDKDSQNPRGVFLGANDGASGVALFMELGRHLVSLEGKYGVDLIFFDGEEFVWTSGTDPMFLGSEYFSQVYANRGWDVKYAYGILVDMIGDKDLQIYYEKNSFEFAPKLCKSIWSVAAELGVKEFIQEPNHQIRDDHLPLNTIAKIKTCDIIDFDYPNPGSKNKYWHTQSDIPANCSAESLQKVGGVLLEWLRQLQKL